jgi:hypothetical protein
MAFDIEFPITAPCVTDRISDITTAAHQHLAGEVNRDGQERQDKERAKRHSCMNDFRFYPVHPVDPCLNLLWV